MDTSVIDLCDSDDDNAKDDDSSSSSSSSSSDDSHLWNAGGFLKGSTPRKKREGKVKVNVKVKSGNYFEEVKSKCGNDHNGNGNGKKEKEKHQRLRNSHDAKHAFENSPIVSLEIEGEGFDYGDESDGDGSLKMAAVEPKNIDSLLQKAESHHPTRNGRKDKKRKSESPINRGSSTSSSSSSVLSSPSKKQCKINNKNYEQVEVECIEIDLCDSSSDDDANAAIDNKRNENERKADASKKKKNVHHGSKPSSKSAVNMNMNKESDSDESDSDASDSDESDFDTDFRAEKKRPAAVNAKKTLSNPYAKKKNISSMPAKSKPAKKKSYDSEISDEDDDKVQQQQNPYKTKNKSIPKKKAQVKNNPCKTKNIPSIFAKSKPAKKKSCNSEDSDEDDDDSYSSAIPSISAKSKPGKKKSYNSEDSDEDDSSATVSLPENHTPAMEEFSDKMSPPRLKEGSETEKKKNGKKGSVSFNNTDDANEFSANDDDDDFGFDTSYGGFEYDDDDDVQLPSKADDVSQTFTKENHTKAFAQSKAKPKQPNKSLKKDDVELLDSDSDGESSDSSAELFTPRPFKKKAKLPPPAAAATNKSEEQSETKTPTAAKSESSDMKCPNSTSSKLLTPCAFSPANTSPTLGTYAVKNQVPTPAIPAMDADLVKEIGGKLYPDLRHNFLVALTNHARRLRHNSYQRASFDAALRSVVVISLHTRPLRSAQAVRRIKGVGSNFYDLLKESIAGVKGKKPYAPAVGKYSCVSSAALVALLQLEEESSATSEAASASANNGKSFPMEDLLSKMNTLLDARANASLKQAAQMYLDPDNLDPGWGQIKKLASANAAADLGGPFLKERKKKDACPSGRIYELLDSGRAHAKKLREISKAGPDILGPLRQLPDETVDEQFGSVTMSMDFREGGGHNLHKMCDQLDAYGVPYVVRELKIADYLFFVGDKLAPILIERKTAEDVASSLHDGRWERQQRSMRKAQYVLGGGEGRRCQICYIIEGDASKKKVHGGNVGRRTYFQSLEDVENAIDELPKLGFSVMKSKGILDTIGVLAKVARDVSWKAKNGSIDANFSYQEFLSRVKALGDELGDPPTLREHMNPAPPVVVNEEHIPEPVSNHDIAADDRDGTFSPQADPVQNNSVQFKRTAASVGNSTRAIIEENEIEYEELKKCSIARLKERCKERDEKIGGKKDDLIARLLKPRKPEILIMRARRGEYVPKVPSCNAALMVALLLHHVPGTQGVTKERLLVLAEESGVSKESMGGDGGSFYDGWSGVKQLQEGDPALVRREKGQRYSLTTQPPETSGRAVAHALHIVAHREGLCSCANPPQE